MKCCVGRPRLPGWNRAATLRRSCDGEIYEILEAVGALSALALLIRSASGNDLFDYRRLRVCVVLDVVPPASRKLTLSAFIELPLLGSGSQPIAKQQHPLYFRTPGGEHMHLHVRIVISQEPMLVPVRLSKLQDVSGSLQIREIPCLVCRVDHRQHDVDDRFRCKARYRRRPNVFDLHRPSAQRRPNALLFTGVLRRPYRVRVYEPDWPIGTYRRLQEVRLRSVRHCDRSKQLLDQLLDPLADLVTDGPDDIDALTGRIVERPVLVAFPAIVRTTVTASHRDNHVRGLDCVGGEDCGLFGSDVDAFFGHRLYSDGVDLVGRFATS